MLSPSYRLYELEAMIQMTQSKVLLDPPACKPYGLEANVSLLGYLPVPLNLSLRYFRPSRILPHDPL